MMSAHWAFGEQTGSEYIYCDASCYEAMEYPYWLQEKNFQEE